MIRFIRKWFVILVAMLHLMFITLGLGIICFGTSILQLENPVHVWRELVYELGVKCFYSRKEWKSLFKC